MAKASWQPDLSSLLNKLDATQNNASEAAAACLTAGADYLYEQYEKGLARHRQTGKAMESLVKKEPVKEGEVYSMEIGSFYDEGRRGGFMHAIYQEYGTPTFAADPWMRPVYDSAKPELNKRYKQIIKDIVGG